MEAEPKTEPKSPVENGEGGEEFLDPKRSIVKEEEELDEPPIFFMWITSNNLIS